MRKKFFLSVLAVLIFISVAAFHEVAQCSETATTPEEGAESLKSGEAQPEVKGPVISTYGNMFRGYEFAKVVMFELSDYQCQDCSRYVLEIFPEMEKEYVKTNKIKYVFLDFPLDSHKQAFKAAEAANCAGDQGKFLEMHMKLYGNQNKLDINDLIAYAESLNVDMAKFKECLQNNKYPGKIRADIASGQKAGVTETPAFLLGLAEPTGAVKVVKVIKGAHPYSDYKNAIEDLLSSVARETERKFYVRQTLGDDSNDGLSPEKAWKHLDKLSASMKPGDIAYIGPGLYREQIRVNNSGAPGEMLTFVADTAGQYTGDPPGTVMITGADPVNEDLFKPYSFEGVYVVKVLRQVWGVVEMDGPQYRYENVTITKEFHVDKMTPVDIVAKFPSSFYYDESKKILYIHTSDGKHPREHELEIIMRLTGISTLGKSYITVTGFTFRHMGDSGISFSTGTGDSVAINNTVYGSRVGIRVRNAKNITLYGNTLFRNENSGIYFLSESTNCLAIGNISYENIKGIRWGSGSNQGFALNNVLFDNIDAGLSVEVTNGIIAQGNRMANNKKYQLLLYNGEMSSLDNCFEKGAVNQLLTEFTSYVPYPTVSEAQKVKEAKIRDLMSHSREGNCGPFPEKMDVLKVHKETMDYTEKARKMLKTPE